MSTINDIIINEKPVDVILFLTHKSGIDHPRIDRLYSLNNWPHIKDNMRLADLICSMAADGLIESNNGRFTKGPNWRTPQFMLENKYTL
ncbi:hypothetical protein KSS94_12040 [Pseudomonas fakonensis]|uniref:Immunity protein n=1 Tax=Pseudomonas fakonensis TaxID=2842355 RepID=A0ABX8NBQ2_9PSED|nr:hypothetical protein [Pseudomonas fakonensis]QXH53799.1 hypothetical protein KSS94_12040 [Pseudomonas fakonensis]